MSDRLGSEYRKLLLAITSSNLGNGIVLAAFPLIAASITKNPLAISGIAAVAGLPWLFMGPIAGTLADRHNRRHLMIAVDLFRAVAMGVLAVYIGFGGTELLVLYAIVLLVGFGEPVVDTSAQAMVPKTVTTANLDLANGRLLAAGTVAQRFAGPILGGVLFGISAWIPVASDATTFLLAALIIVRLPPTFGRVTRQASQTQSFFGETGSGLKWMWDEPTIRAFTIGGAILHFVRAAIDGILVLVAVERLDLGGMGFATLLAASGIGFVFGTQIAPKTMMFVPRWIVATASVVVTSLTFIIVGLTTNGVVAGIALLTVGIASGHWTVISLSYRLRVAPDRLLGRVLAGHLFVVHGAVPLGAIAGGIAANTLGLQAPFFIGAVVTVPLIFYMKAAISGVELDPTKLVTKD